MSFMVGKGVLADAIKKLDLAWDIAQKDWRDDRARDLEERYLTEARRVVAIAMKGIERMNEMAAQAERECGPDA